MGGFGGQRGASQNKKTTFKFTWLLCFYILQFYFCCRSTRKIIFFLNELTFCLFIINLSRNFNVMLYYFSIFYVF
jgi:hypothetical protein